MREFFTIAIFKIKADIRMNKTTLNSQKEKHSMLSLRRATSVALPGLRLHLNFYPRSPCGERQAKEALQKHLIGYFYPRSPCGERLIAFLHFATLKFVFLSTLSLRRATRDFNVFPYCIEYFYPRSPCGERQRAVARVAIDTDFYPRSPCGERLKLLAAGKAAVEFLSTLSLRRATHQLHNLVVVKVISIHALLAESDRC